MRFGLLSFPGYQRSCGIVQMGPLVWSFASIYIRAWSVSNSLNTDFNYVTTMLQLHPSLNLYVKLQQPLWGKMQKCFGYILIDRYLTLAVFSLGLYCSLEPKNLECLADLSAPFALDTLAFPMIMFTPRIMSVFYLILFTAHFSVIHLRHNKMTWD